MFTETADLYDAIYLSFKDYVREADQVAALLRAEHSGCRSVLDVACGTGEHARLLATRHGFAVDGIDLDGEFVRLAHLKHPAGRFVQADMAEFTLGRQYDAVMCLFSSIAYLVTLDKVTRALGRFRGHLADGGVAVVEPWFVPGVLQHGYRSTHTGEANGVRVERNSMTEVDGRISRLHFDYVIETPAGTRRASEVHELGLFTVEETLAAFNAAGLAARYDPEGLTGRGLYVARVPA